MPSWRRGHDVSKDHINIAKDFYVENERLKEWFNQAQNIHERRSILDAMDHLERVFNATVASTYPGTGRNPWGRNPCGEIPLDKMLTPRERFDKGNSRREAIMAQRERHV